MEKSEISSQESQEPEKERKWKEIEERIRNIPEIESGVVEIITALNALGFATAQSCEGHGYCDTLKTDAKVVSPWVELGAPDRPSTRFLEQEKITKALTRKYRSMPRKIIDNMINYSGPEGWVQKKYNNPEETAEYKKWREETKIVMEKLAGLLEKCPKDLQFGLKVRENYRGSFIMSSGELSEEDEGLHAESWQKMKDEELGEQHGELAKELTSRRENFDAFAKFLKEKFFDE